jgi:hypothetical protein
VTRLERLGVEQGSIAVADVLDRISTLVTKRLDARATAHGLDLKSLKDRMSHTGQFRSTSEMNKIYCCSIPNQRDGMLCTHKGGIISEDHWSCCGQKERSAPCRRFQNQKSEKEILDDLRAADAQEDEKSDEEKKAEKDDDDDDEGTDDDDEDEY